MILREESILEKNGNLIYLSLSRRDLCPIMNVGNLLLSIQDCPWHCRGYGVTSFMIAEKCSRRCHDIVDNNQMPFVRLLRKPIYIFGNLYPDIFGNPYPNFLEI